MTSPDLLEALRSGAVRVVPVEATQWQWRSRLKGSAWDAWEQGRFGQEIPPFAEVEKRAVFTVSPASPDHTPDLLALIEGLKKERDEALQAFAGGAYADACKGGGDIYQHALALTVEQFRKAEARALAAEAERDALREALAPFANCIFNDNGDITVNFRSFTADELIAAYFAHKRARALTQEQPNVGE